MVTFEGTHYHIGYEYGKAFAEGVRDNLRILIHRVGYEPLPLENPEFAGWVEEQERLIGNAWPWLIEEMRGVAAGSGAEYRDILLLNLRPWQWEYYGLGMGTHQCSSLVINLSDGTVANSGALDDGKDYYCGPVRFAPQGGYRFITFPITGTSWCMRALNSAGLAIGISSQLLPGLLRKPGTINQDLATRAIAETCATVEQVREFCREHPFTQNLVCSDAEGRVFCAHATSAGLYELAATAPFCMTNHVVSDDIVRELSSLGVKEFPYAATTRERRGNMLRFINGMDGKASAEEVRKAISTRDDSDPGSNTNPGTIAVTYANPQAEPGIFWVAEPNGDKLDWQPFNV